MLSVINTYDIETYTDNSNNRIIPYCLCFIYDNIKYIIYYENYTNIIIESITLIAKNMKNSECEIYIHNLNFDGVLIINEITKSKIRFEISAIKTNIYYLKIYYMSKIIKFRCSYKIIPLSLRTICDFEDVQKKMYFPYKFSSFENLFYIGGIPDRKYWDNDDYKNFIEQNIITEFNFKKISIDYCLNDVIILQNVLIKVFKIFDKEKKNILSNSYSIPSIGSKIFFDMKPEIDQKISIELDSFSRNAFYGGRCEVFGNIYDFEHIKYYDFSGMYGQCMMEDYHIGKGEFVSKGNWMSIGFHTIKYRCSMDIPILPKHIDNKLMFVNGEHIGTFWWEEILFFYELGGEILEVYTSYVYNKKKNVFSDFVSYYTKLREKGGYYKIISKLLINSLYGGFAFKNNETTTIITYSEEEFISCYKSMNIINYYKVNNTYIINVKKDYKYRSLGYKNKKDYLRNVTYAAAIASKARIKLYRAFIDVINDGGRLLYCDTDSIFAGYPKNNIDSNFSDKKWLNIYNDGFFMSPKSYALYDSTNFIIKIKGATTKQIDYYDLKKKFYESGSIEIKDQLNIKRSDLVLTQNFIKKKILFSDNSAKRLFTDDKKKTLPIKIYPGI